MFTFIQAQTQYDREGLFRKDRDNLVFFHQIQRALLNSLYEEKLISSQEYEQCCTYLETIGGA